MEVETDHDYLEVVMFENECGAIIEQEVRYEWKPIYCTACGNYGHDINECMRQIREDKGKEKSITGKENNKQTEQRGEPKKQKQIEASDKNLIEQNAGKH